MNDDEKIRVDLSRLTMADLADALDACGVKDLAAASGGDQIRSTIAFAWVWKRKTDPTYTYEEASTLPIGSIEVVDGKDADPEVSGAHNGAPPRESLVSGPSTPPT